jgi:hypothetical protein
LIAEAGSGAKNESSVINSEANITESLFRMKRLIMFTVLFVLVFIMTAIAVDESSLVPVKAEIAEPATVKETRGTHVSFTGIVKAISDTTLMVERTVRDKAETLEFALDKPVEKIKIGDKVKVSFVKKEGKYIAAHVTLVVNKKIIKKDTPKTK